MKRPLWVVIETIFVDIYISKTKPILISTVHKPQNKTFQMCCQFFFSKSRFSPYIRNISYRQISIWNNLLLKPISSALRKLWKVRHLRQYSPEITINPLKANQLLDYYSNKDINIYIYKPPLQSQHPVKFCGHKYCENKK